MGLKACLIGSGNWGSAIARIIGETVQKYSTEFDGTVTMWVFEEEVEGRKLSEIINTDHVNVKYLPGVPLPHNVVANPDLIDSAKDADFLIFVVPHQFVPRICSQLTGKIKSSAIGISLIKGFAEVERTEKEKSVHSYQPSTTTSSHDSSHSQTHPPQVEGRGRNPKGVLGLWNRDSTIESGLSCINRLHNEGLAIHDDGGIRLISSVIKDVLKIDVYCLMGANLAREVAIGNFCEATIGTSNKEHGAVLKRLFQTDNFRIVTVEDQHTVELCGALKNVVACGAGFTDGLGYGDNTKAAVIRLGLMEMTKFIEHFYPGSNLETFFESCGIADLVTTCYGGRNRKVCEAFIKTGKSIEVLEKEMLNGQCLQGPHTAAQVYTMLESNKMEDKFPMFAAVHRICIGQVKATEFIECLRNHPEHM